MVFSTKPFNAFHVPITPAENTAKQMTNMQKPIMITVMFFYLLDSFVDGRHVSNVSMGI